MLKELFSSTKRIVIKIIPHHSTSVYKVELSHRHAAMLGACAVVVAAAMVTFQIGAVGAANAKVRALQADEARQRAQLQAFSRKTHDMASRLDVLAHSERAIRSLTGITNSPKRTAPMRMEARIGPGKPLTWWDSVRSFMRGGSGGPAATFASESAELTTLDIRLNAALADSRDLEAKATAAAQAKRAAALARQRYLDAIPSIWPTEGYVSSGFGYRSYPDAEFHPGIDVVNDYGSPVYATATGVVEEAGWDGGYGYKIVIDHGNGLETWYAHNSRVLVGVGDTVRKGEEIARIGSTGYATGPHVHYEIVELGRPIDPTPFLSGIPAQFAR